MTLRTFVLALLPVTASAQFLTFGVQGGVPIQSPLGKTDTTPFVLGPEVDIRILPGLSLETGLLYQRVGRRSDTSVFLYPENSVALGSLTSRGSALELPFLAKYRFLSGRRNWRPFLSVGPTVRRTSITTNSLISTISTSPLTPNGLSAYKAKTVQWNLDPSAGVGVDMRTGRFHLEPEVRYSYWGAGKSGPVRKNQVNFLLGFRF